MSALIEKIRSESEYKNVYISNYNASRNFFWTLFFVYVCVYSTKLSFGAALASIVSEGIFTKSQTGLISASFYIFYGPLQILGGIWADKYNNELLIKVSIIGASIANLIIFLNHNYYVMLTVWILNGLVQFPLWTAIFKLISSVVSNEYKPRAMFNISFCISVAMAFSFIISALCPSWEYNFAISFILLFISFIAIHIIFRKTEKHFTEPENTSDSETKISNTILHTGLSNFRLFLVSGFILLIPLSVLRCIVENAVKSFAPTMLIESYENISLFLSNLLNVLIVLSGLLGLFLLKKLLYPKLIKNELTAQLIPMLLSIPFSIILIFIGRIHPALFIISMCAISVLFTPTAMLVNVCCAKFAKFGRNGFAAGIINMAGSFSLILTNYVLLKVADLYNWKTVAIIWLAMIIVGCIGLLLIIRRWSRFENMKIFKDT